MRREGGLEASRQQSNRIYLDEKEQWTLVAVDIRRLNIRMERDENWCCRTGGRGFEGVVQKLF
jgi:hypothetical protein